MNALSLAASLREGTAESHARAEGTPWARALARGSVPRGAYAAYLSALVPVYDALEEAAAERADDPGFAPLHDPRLTRGAALRADLVAWGPAERACGTQQAARAARAYAARIRQAAERHPSLLAAHHYVRYLGDLSGGQVVAAALRRSGARDPGDSGAGEGAGEGEGEGTAFYDFSDALSPTARGGQSLVPYVRGYRDALDALPLDGVCARDVVAEAVASFEATIGIFEAMESLLPPEQG